MHRIELAILVALGLLATACSPKPDFLEMEPRQHAFKRAGEDLWWKAVAKKRDGRTLHKAKVAWSSSDPKVVTVDEVGRAKAVGPGRATITASVGTVKAEAIAEVVVVGKVVVEPAELSFEARGEPKPIAMKVYDQEGRLLTDRMPMARCMNEDVCRTASDGVHPVDPGETTLVVTAEGQKAEIPVSVVPAKAAKK